MDENLNQNCVSKLIALFESLLNSTNQSKIGIETHSMEAQKLLQGWVLPDHEGSELICSCAESQKNQLNGLFEKVEKAVKYSQSIREGRNDVSSPWPEDIEKNASIVEEKKSNTGRNFSSMRSVVSANREKSCKGKVVNCTQKRHSNSTLSSIQCKSLDDQEQSSSFCPLHGTPQYENSQKTKKLQTVCLAEALDVKGIPPELVTILRSFHQYINRLRTTNLKNRAETAFLRHLNCVNEAKWEKFALSSLLNNLATNSTRRCTGKIPIFEEDEERQDKSQAASQFSGIWNPAICNITTVGAFCIQYQNDKIWNLLQIRLQQLQLSHVEWQVCDILSCDPLLCNPDVHYRSASLFLKTATALSRLTALNLPVLVKSCTGE